MKKAPFQIDMRGSWQFLLGLAIPEILYNELSSTLSKVILYDLATATGKGYECLFFPSDEFNENFCKLGQSGTLYSGNGISLTQCST